MHIPVSWEKEYINNFIMTTCIYMQFSSGKIVSDVSNTTGINWIISLSY